MPLSIHNNPATTTTASRRGVLGPVSSPVVVGLDDDDSSDSSSSGSSEASVRTPPTHHQQQEQATPTRRSVTRTPPPSPPLTPRTPVKAAVGGSTSSASPQTSRKKNSRHAPSSSPSPVRVTAPPSPPGSRGRRLLRNSGGGASSSKNHNNNNNNNNDNCSTNTPTISNTSSSHHKRQQLRRMNHAASIIVSDPVEEATADQRLVDYFIVVSSKPKQAEQQLNNINVNVAGGDSPSRSSNNNIAESRQEQDDCSTIPPHASTPSAATTTATRGETTQNGTTTIPTFAPKITARYPAVDYADNPLNAMIPQFCFPTLPHDHVISPVSTYELPRVHHFVLTNEKGRKVYGTCLTVLEELAPPLFPSSYFDEKSRQHQQQQSSMSSSLTVLEDLSSFALNLAGIEVDNRPPRNSNGHAGTSKTTLYIPKVLCLLSSWPYLTAFREYVAQLYRLATTTNIMSAPIERYITNICLEIPAPPPGAYEIQVDIMDSTIRFWAPPGKLPLAHVALPFHVLFECLDVEHILHVWSALITERKILLVSSQFSILTICCEVLCSLLFPLRWSHLYIPLLPRNFCAVLDAPVPYLCGLVRECWSHAEPFISPETIVVDLDHNTITYGNETPRIPEVPAKKWNKLHNSLQETVGHLHWKTHGLEESYRAMMTLKPKQRSMEQLLRQEQAGQGRPQWMEKLDGLDRAFNLAYTPDSKLLEDYYRSNYGGGDDGELQQTPWDKVQEAFLRFFVAILKNYRRYLFIPLLAATSPDTKATDEDPHHHPYSSSGSISGRAQQPSFDVAAFLAAQPAHSAPFLYQMCMSQQFDSFITRRMYSPGEPDLIFFDQSIGTSNYSFFVLASPSSNFRMLLILFFCFRRQAQSQQTQNKEG
jgi:DENN (AEX-3) domain/uDENN domain/dDENN domain